MAGRKYLPSSGRFGGFSVTNREQESAGPRRIPKLVQTESGLTLVPEIGRRLQQNHRRKMRPRHLTRHRPRARRQKFAHWNGKFRHMQIAHTNPFASKLLVLQAAPSAQALMHLRVPYFFSSTGFADLHLTSLDFMLINVHSPRTAA